MLAYIYPVGGSGGEYPDNSLPGFGGRPDNSLPPQFGGGRPDNSLPGGGARPSHPISGGGVGPSHPIVLPPLPGVWPKPGEPTQPIVIPPEVSNPIVIPGEPEHPIALPPGTVWPPLPPSTTGKYAILIWVVGVGARWLIVDAGTGVDNTLPGSGSGGAQPKSF
jgi:hypothetical protein